MKAKHKEQDSRETQQSPHTKERQGVGEGGQAPGHWQGLKGCQAQLICSQGIKGLREPSLDVT